MISNKQIITIKGTRDGLTLQINDQCSYTEVRKELQQQLSNNPVSKDDKVIKVTIQLGNRLLSEEQQEELKSIILEKQHLKVEAFESAVITKEEALEWQRNTEVKSMVRMIRSGQVINIEGDLLLIGDVNPGGKVMATGNIFILGSLKGIAHAGVDGNRDAVIIASYMQPNQLRIAEYISRSPDYESDGVYMECGYFDEEEDKIRMDRLQEIVKRRPDISSFERRMLNG
ncbi:septum site-determining protein MinC [Thalassobacillus hwangdonensis]|uniref:Probable septum site-determining protein MinC n=1 Tax=Thalassobacillus hwangdonensis TaxID=546108 RepID=A0ABW3L079_9BACI